MSSPVTIVSPGQRGQFDRCAVETTDLKTTSARKSGIGRSFLSGLHCPYCGSNLDLISQLPEQCDADQGEAIQYGIVQCACHRYPVVDGVLILQHVEGLQRVVGFIKNGDNHRALLQAMNLFRVKWAQRTRWHKLKYYLNCRRLVSRQNLSFEDAVDLARRPKVFSDYLFHRYANPSFLGAIGALQLLSCVPARTATAGPARVLDLACGAGHSSFLMRLLYPELSVISVDHDFVSLYLAKRYLAPDATHLCLDAEVPSPFADDYFSAVFCLDAFHYLHSKQAVVAELRRISTPEAIWLFPHLHNALQQNITAGIPLPPEQYLDCFGVAKPRIFDETAVLHGMTQRLTLDLRTQPTPGELEKAPNLTLMAGPESLWREHHQFPASFCNQRSRLVLNPIYDCQNQGDKLECVFTWPNEVMRNECRGAEAILPASCRLDKAEVRNWFHGNGASDDARLRELVTKFVLVPLPANYTRDRGMPA